MWKLARRTIRYRGKSLTATFLALFLGTVTVMTCGGLLETGVRNNAPAQRLARADLVVTGDRSVAPPNKSDDTEDPAVMPERVPVPAAALARVRGVEGVREAVAERTFDAALVRDVRGGGAAPVKAQAHGWASAAFAPYGIVEGTAPAQDGEVALDAGTAKAAGVGPGDEVRIAAGDGTRQYTVSAVVEAGQQRAHQQKAHQQNTRQQQTQQHMDRAALFLSDDRAAALAPAVADIAVRTESGADLGDVRDRVAAALDGQPLKVVSGDGRGTVEFPEVLTGGSDLVALAGVFGGMTTIVAIMVVSGTVALSVGQRRREFGLLRSIGSTQRQLRRMLLTETLMVAVAAAGAGWFAGPPVGRWLFGEFQDTGFVSDSVTYAQGWIPAVAAGGALLITALIGGWLGARRGVNVKPVEALREAEVQLRWAHPLRIVLAVLFLSGAAALAILTVLLFDGPIAGSTAGPTVLCAVIGFALLGPGLTKVMAWLIGGPVRRLTGAGGKLAVSHARVRAVRMAAAVTPLMLATGMATGNIYLQTTQIEATNTAYAANLRADAVLSPAAGGVSDALLAEVRRTKGVEAASAYATSTGFIDGVTGEDGIPLQGVSGRQGSLTTAVRPVTGSLAALEGNTVALTTERAHKLHKAVGDSFTLRLGDRAEVDVRIVALFKGHPGYETAFLPAGLLAAHTDLGRPAQILVRAPASAVPALASLAPGVDVTDRHSLIEANAEDAQTQAWINYLLIAMIVAYTVLAVVNSLVLSVGNRRREFALQRLVGSTKGQVMKMLTIEALIVAAIGLLLGTAAASTSLIPFAQAAANTWMPSGPWWIYGAIVAGAVTLSLTATLLPAWTALRTRPVEAAGAQE
ncbi:FtsX-like permease family protein [Streptomyces sp. NPDC002790]|uniref:FtsX-like permease family protein n=1 Tax=Streptomyces sp. NPDC002790 TaxID=3154431 RepID=UPI00332C2D0B